MPFPLKRVSLNIPLQRVKQLLEEDAELEPMVKPYYWLSDENRRRRVMAIRYIHQILNPVSIFHKRKETSKVLDRVLTPSILDTPCIPFLSLLLYDGYTSRMGHIMFQNLGAADMEQTVEATVLACLHIAFHHLNRLQVPLGAHPYLVESVRYAIQVEDVIMPLTFLDYFVEELNSMLVCKRKDMGTEARLIIEMLYYRIEVLKYQPSVVAAAAALACISNLSDWMEKVWDFMFELKLDERDIIGLLYSNTGKRYLLFVITAIMVFQYYLFTQTHLPDKRMDFGKFHKLSLSLPNTKVTVLCQMFALMVFLYRHTSGIIMWLFHEYC